MRSISYQVIIVHGNVIEYFLFFCKAAVRFVISLKAFIANFELLEKLVNILKQWEDCFISMLTSFMCMSQKLVFHQSKCISAIKRILSTTAMYVSSSSFIYLRIPCYCDACLNSSALRVGVKALLNTIYVQPLFL